MRRSNCLVFAVYAWMRLGGYVVARRSHHSRLYPHFLWLDFSRRHIVSFKPAKPVPGFHSRWIWFKGQMRWGDEGR